MSNNVYNDEYSSLDNSARYIAPLMVKYLNKNVYSKGNIIDIGCGKGGILNELIKNFGGRFKFYGMDYYYKPEKNIDQITYIKQDLNGEFGNINIKFDVVICTEVIEHVIDTDKFIKQIHKMLKKNGLLIITTPNLSSFYNRILLLFGYQPLYTEVSWEKSFLGTEIVENIYRILGKENKIDNKIFGHLRIFTFRALISFLIHHGFTIEYKTGCNPLSEGIVRKISGLFKMFPSSMPNIFVVARKNK